MLQIKYHFCQITHLLMQYIKNIGVTLLRLYEILAENKKQNEPNKTFVKLI